MYRYIICLFISLFAVQSIDVYALTVSNLRVNKMINPSGIDSNPNFSWWLDSDTRGCIQASYRITIIQGSSDGSIIYDSGEVTSSQSCYVTIDDFTFVPSERYWWNITVKDNYGNVATSCEEAFFDTGIGVNGWDNAKWIYNPQNNPQQGVSRFRKEFNVEKEIDQAYIYSSALGIYDLFLNGKRVGHQINDSTSFYEELKPGWTDYRKRVFYQTHDITSYLQEKNVIGLAVSDGWWKGEISAGVYGNQSLCCLVKILLKYKDGTSETIVTDNSWYSTNLGPFLYSGIYEGENYDAEREDNWLLPEYDMSSWQIVENYEYKGDVVSSSGLCVKTLDNLTQAPCSIKIYDKTELSGGDYGIAKPVNSIDNGLGPIVIKKDQIAIIDFGQNIVGWSPFGVKGEKGTSIRIRYSEMLNDDGAISRGNDGPGGFLYLSNLRTAKATLYYTLRGDSCPEHYCSSSTYYGFRYCEIVPDNDICLTEIKALPISSSFEDSGYIITNNTSVNRLFNNIIWSQRGNILSVPTDCPQRDERYGWTGDAQIFCRTSCYNSNLEYFWRKYLCDLRDFQDVSANSAYPDVAPFVPRFYWGNAGWADAGIIIPWNLYLMYGNKEILEEHYSSMRKYMDWLSTEKLSELGISFTGPTCAYGDWLAYDDTDGWYVMEAYYANDARLMSKIALIISSSPDDNYSKESAEYERLFHQLKKYFNEKFWNPQPQHVTQTTCLLALAFDLVDDDNKEDVITLLESLIKDNGGKLSTGFLGTSVLLQTLSKNGLNEDAYNLFLQHDNPSWLYSVDQGATTIWERWNSYTKDNGFGPTSMNSFNHYAYGVVGEWMYRYMSGIDISDQSPGFQNFVLRPQFDMRPLDASIQDKIDYVKGVYYSDYGEIVSEYQLSDKYTCSYKCKIPVNTTARLYLPIKYNILENDEDGNISEDVIFEEQEGEYTVYLLGSGDYSFSSAGTSYIVKNKKKTDEIRVFPCITKGKINIESILRIDNITLYDSAGKILLFTNKEQQVINIDNLSNGFYVLKVKTGQGEKSFKILKI